MSRYVALLGGLIVACATMANVHTSPHTVFHSEWFAAFGSLLAGYVLLGQSAGRFRLGSFALVATLLLFASLLHATGVGANSGAPL